MALLIKDIIPQVVVQELDWRTKLLAHWPSVVGSLQTKVTLDKMYDDTLIIGVYESQWMQELYLLSSLMIDTINTFLGEPKIAHLKFKLVAPRVHLRPKKRAAFIKKNIELVLTEGQKSALQEISDETLKAALISFWVRCQEMTS